MTGEDDGTDDAAPRTDPATTLARARERVEALAAEDGTFHVACARTGARPEPVAGTTFPSHDDAVTAAAAAREYRAALGELDPGAREYDLVVVAGGDGDLEVTCARERADGVRANGLPRARRTATAAGTRDGEWLRMDDAPVVHLSRAAEPVDDEAVERQLDAKL